ncbi:MAG TPA: hypothetical protein VFA46_09760 [Actinomycetes bacterium]|jgi:ABC-type dipeptide/oligopeptide/nickel transport system ATPase subunit|nr:hypothetical protein [Actinomycetes bacterium]
MMSQTQRTHDLRGPAVEVTDLVKVYQAGRTATTALGGVSFAVQRGEIADIVAWLVCAM